MFYHQELLSRRKGKFSLIWMAATCGKSKTGKFRLKEKQFFSVDVRGTCRQLMEYIPGDGEGGTSKKRQIKFSLYLCSQLMYGVVVIYQLQMDACFKDAQRLLEGTKRPVIIPSKSQDLPKKKRKAPKEAVDLPANFGSFDSDSFQQQMELLGSPESDVILGLGQLSETQYAGNLMVFGDRHTARLEDITLREEASQSFGMPGYQGVDLLAPLDEGEMPIPFLNIDIEEEMERPPQTLETPASKETRSSSPSTPPKTPVRGSQDFQPDITEQPGRPSVSSPVRTPEMQPYRGPLELDLEPETPQEKSPQRRRRGVKRPAPQTALIRDDITEETRKEVLERIWALDNEQLPPVMTVRRALKDMLPETLTAMYKRPCACPPVRNYRGEWVSRMTERQKELWAEMKPFEPRHEEVPADPWGTPDSQDLKEQLRLPSPQQEEQQMEPGREERPTEGVEAAAMEQEQTTGLEGAPPAAAVPDLEDMERPRADSAEGSLARGRPSSLLRQTGMEEEPTRPSGDELLQDLEPPPDFQQPSGLETLIEESERTTTGKPAEMGPPRNIIEMPYYHPTAFTLRKDALLQEIQSGEEGVWFHDICPESASRAQAAKKFFLVLCLSGARKVDVEQSQPYGPIRIVPV